MKRDMDSLSSLRRSWLAWLWICLLLLSGGWMLLQAEWEPRYAWRWLILSSLGLVYPLTVLWQSLEHNRRSGDSLLLPNLGPGNNLTLLRGVLVAMLAGFLASPRPEGWIVWIPGALYLLADLADYLDGYLARVSNHVTRLGEILDLRFDGLGILIAALLAIQYGQVPPWYLSVALARYLFLAGLWIHKRRGGQVYELPPSMSRRALAGVQMGFIGFILLPVFSPPGTHFAALCFALPFLAGFARDFFYAAGILRPAPTSGTQPSGKQHTFICWLPVAIRLAVSALSLWILVNAAGMRSGLPEPHFTLLSVLQALTALLLLLGVAGRATAILGLLLLGIAQTQAALSFTQLSLLFGYTALLFLGTGALSLWRPEDQLINHRAGEKVPAGATTNEPANLLLGDSNG